MVEATVTMATAAPIHGSERDIRRDNRMPPHRATRFDNQVKLAFGEINRTLNFSIAYRRRLHPKSVID